MRCLLTITWALLTVVNATPARSTPALPALPAVEAADRIVIVAPHPDDEALATGGLIQQALAVGADLHVIYLTNGDHNQVAFKLYQHRLFLRAPQYLAFGEKRRCEALDATTLLGLTTNHLAFLGYPDWGTLRIWRDYWEDGDRFRSDATRATAVPYPEAVGYQRPYTPESVEADLTTLLRQWQPTKVFITHPGDTNPDHRAVANFVRLALLDLEPTGLHPQVFYYVVHFGNWSHPLGYHPGLQLAPPPRLLDNGNWMTLPLTPSQTTKKYLAILENETQLTIGRRFLLSLARANELFATMPLETIPIIPADVKLNWRTAVRNKAIQYVPHDNTDKLSANGHRLPVKIGLEDTAFIRQCDDLIAQIEYKNWLGRRTNVHLFLYGYRRGTPFTMLPKVQINLPPIGGINVYVDDKPIHTHSIRVETIGNRSFVRVPLSLLGGPDLDHIFTATRANLGEISPDDTAWQLFALRSDSDD